MLRKTFKSKFKRFYSIFVASIFRFFQWLSVLALNPNPIHFQHFASVDLQPSVDSAELLEKPSRREQLSQLFLREKVTSRSIASKVKILLQAFPALEPQLRQVVPPVIPEQHETAGLQIFVKLVQDVRKLFRMDGGQNEDQHDNVDGAFFKRNFPFVSRRVEHESFAPLLVVLRAGLEDVDGLWREIRGVNHQLVVRVVVLEDGEDSWKGKRMVKVRQREFKARLTVADSRADLEDLPCFTLHRRVHRIVHDDLLTFWVNPFRRCSVRCQFREFREQPVTIFEEFVLVDAVKRVPAF